MGIFIKTATEPTQLPVFNNTSILNRHECEVSAVGLTLSGDLCYRKNYGWLPSVDIESVHFIQSKRLRGQDPSCSVEADFDIHTSSGKTIEVHTCDVRLIKAALAYAPVVDKRAKLRAARREG